MYGATLGNHRYNFSNLATLLAKASPLRSGDILAGVAAQSGEERVAAQFALADLPVPVVNSILSFPKIPSGPDSHRKTESSHH